MSIEPIVPQILFVIPNNKIMTMQNIFHDMNKYRMETTYTLSLGQLLKIALDFKKYM